MIFVDRKSVAPPREFMGNAEHALLELTEDVHRLTRQKHFQQRLPFNSELWKFPDLLAALGALFKHRCAFCETRLTSAETRAVAFFRPRERASSLEGDVAPLHYWWLAYEWTNLYSICNGCHSVRGTRFPVEGPRAQESHGARAADNEKALLLDPCRDDPEAELEFHPDGTVTARTEGAQNSIEIFSLNRPTLVRARAAARARVDATVDSLLASGGADDWTSDSFAAAVCTALPEDAQYMALARQLARRRLADAPPRPRMAAAAPPPPSATAAGASVPIAESAPAKIQVIAAQAGVKRPAVAGSVHAYKGAIWLQSVHIENFKAIRALDLAFPDHTAPLPIADENAQIVQTAASQPPHAPWLMLLGENGVGKSSVLKAIAFAMMKPKQRQKYAPDPRQWVNRAASRRAGCVRLEFTTGAEPLELHFSRRSPQVVVKGEMPGITALGYGSTRLLPPKSRRPKPQSIRVQNLFDSHAQLSDAEPWLAGPGVVTRKDFDLLATSLKALLTLSPEDSISRRSSRLIANVNGDRGPIRDLSDGYQSVLALAMDMMLNLSKASFDMEGVEGLVLLDELEVHLHPRWKIAIVGALRTLFPRVRFIATTHDPLCVQGIRKGELHIMTRQGADKDVTIEQFDVPAGARADQILTGAWFGVPTTRDPETVAMMREHSALLQRMNLSPPEQARLAWLDRQLRQRLDEYIGTEDEQIALQAAAQLRDENRVRTGAVGAAGSEELRTKVLEALRSRQPQTT